MMINSRTPLGFTKQKPLQQIPQLPLGWHRAPFARHPGVGVWRGSTGRLAAVTTLARIVTMAKTFFILRIRRMFEKLVKVRWLFA